MSLRIGSTAFLQPVCLPLSAVVVGCFYQLGVCQRGRRGKMREKGGAKRAGVKRYSGIFVDSLYGLIVL